MGRFVRLASAEYSPAGVPEPTGEVRWVNTAQIVSLEEHMGNNLFPRFRAGGRMPAEYCPCLLVSTADGRDRLVGLGTTATAGEGAARLAAAVAALTGAPAPAGTGPVMLEPADRHGP
jgi:hypothetical protein